MPSSRRLKIAILGAFVTTVCLINYFWSSSTLPRPNYLQTLTEMHLKDAAALAAHKSLTDSLRLAAENARGATNLKMTPGSSFLASRKGRIPSKAQLDAQRLELEGGKVVEVPSEKVVAFDGGVSQADEHDPVPRFEGEDGLFVESEEGRRVEEKAKAKAAAKKESDSEKGKVLEEVARILNRSPITIFSKSYCPFAKRVKQLLLSEYRIEPAPYIFEIDQHELGPEIQKWLGEFTGRKTVPNVLINSKSIGGADDLIELDHTGKLVSTIKNLAGNQVSEIERIHEVQDGDVE